MIDKALQFLTDTLNGFIVADDQIVSLTALVTEKGDLNIQPGFIAMSLVNIEEERYMKVQQQRERRTGDMVQMANPEIKLNLMIMLAANPGPKGYKVALDNLSKAITFMQGTSFFTKVTHGDLPAGIDQLTVELVSLTLEQQNQLWASLGAKYIPSVVYKVRLVVIDRQLFGDEMPLVKDIDSDLQKIN